MRPAARAGPFRWKSSTASWPSTSSSGCYSPSVSSKSCRACSTAAKERAERRTTHIAELRKRATEAEAKLKRLYDAIENGIADVSDPMLKERVTELKAVRDQARADAERAEGALDRAGPSITPQALKTFARQARKRMRTSAAATAATTCARSHSASRWTRKKFASWGPKAYCLARSSPRQAQKRQVLACPVLYRSGAPDGFEQNAVTACEIINEPSQRPSLRTISKPDG